MNTVSWFLTHWSGCGLTLIWSWQPAKVLLQLLPQHSSFAAPRLICRTVLVCANTSYWSVKKPATVQRPYCDCSSSLVSSCCHCPPAARWSQGITVKSVGCVRNVGLTLSTTATRMEQPLLAWKECKPLFKHRGRCMMNDGTCFQLGWPRVVPGLPVSSV